MILFGSFFTTLWLTEPAPNNGTAETNLISSGPAIDRLASLPVSNLRDLGQLAERAGLQPARSMRGNIDAVARANDRDVTVSGWLVDRNGDATPSTVMIFVGGKSVAIVKTKAERADVTTALALGFGAEKNVTFQASFACRSGEQPIIVGIGLRSQYLPITDGKSGPCP